jgi:hypothetical protein
VEIVAKRDEIVAFGDEIVAKGGKIVVFGEKLKDDLRAGGKRLDTMDYIRLTTYIVYHLF